MSLDHPDEQVEHHVNVFDGDSAKLDLMEITDVIARDKQSAAGEKYPHGWTRNIPVPEPQVVRNGKLYHLKFANLLATSIC